MMSDIFRWFKTSKPKINDEDSVINNNCTHDKEFVGWGEYYCSVYCSVFGFEYYITKEQYNEHKKEFPLFVPTSKHVCLKCGECFDEDDAAKEWIKKKQKKDEIKKQRQEFAKKLWDDGCRR